MTFKNWRFGCCVRKYFLIFHTLGPAGRQYIKPTAEIEAEPFFENAPADGAFFILEARKGMYY